MNEGLQALHDNQTWEVPCLSGVKSIGSKLVYIMKVESDGSFDRYKARLVVLATIWYLSLNISGQKISSKWLAN